MGVQERRKTIVSDQTMTTPLDCAVLGHTWTGGECAYCDAKLQQGEVRIRPMPDVVLTKESFEDEFGPAIECAACRRGDPCAAQDHIQNVLLRTRVKELEEVIVKWGDASQRAEVTGLWMEYQKIKDARGEALRPAALKVPR